MSDSDDDTSAGGGTFSTVKADTKHVNFPVLKGKYPTEEKTEAWEMYVMSSFEMSNIDHILKTDC